MRIVTENNTYDKLEQKLELKLNLLQYNRNWNRIKFVELEYHWQQVVKKQQMNI